MGASIVATCARVGLECSPPPCLLPSLASATIECVVALRQRGRLLVAGGLALAVVPGVFTPAPALAAARVDAIVWANRDFSSRAPLASWLSARGATYELWSRRHPDAAALLEHLPSPTLHSPTRPVAPRGGGPPSAPTGGSGAVVPSPPAAVPPGGATSSASSSGLSGTATWVTGVLLGVAVIAMVAALVPAAAVVRVLGPGRLSLNRRMYVFGFGLSLCVGVLVAGGRL